MTDALTGKALSRPTREAITIGSGTLSQAVSTLPAGFTLVSQPGPLEQMREDDVARAGLVLETESLDLADLDRLVAAAPKDKPVLGVGGGVVMDSAKWLAIATGAPLVLAPSILSVDACVTNTVATRENGQVTYRGFVEAEHIVLDVDLVRRAPTRLNRAGLGDLLSIHTALWDWAAGERAGVVRVDTDVARQAANVLESVDCLADEIAAVSDAALEAVILGYAEINDMTVACGHAQMEEGSEHFLGYLLEHRTRKTFVHGELVTLGVVLMSRLQGNEPGRAMSIADRASVAWRPDELGLTRDDLAGALLGLREYVEQHGYAYSVANELVLDDQIGKLLEGVA